MVIPDSNIWIDYLNGVSSETVGALDRLVANRRVALTGVVLAEVMRGARDEPERDRIEQLFRRLPYIEMTRRVWTRACQIAQELDAQGHKTPMSDIFIATLALQHDHEVFTRDTRHFERIPGLRLYQPEGVA